ncbi:hypothetical protein NQ314_014349 [Rhamnusium bicolor]|uniref:DDE Tnp4 domain-containing protein n=1 Tax=Rhamnusium bicolor TaxID=1586634 RepID=A0AAV8X1W4_9CUCU|nr:hypothetical protein NQ314_014349 [Rhamnusium bicolor]
MSKRKIKLVCQELLTEELIGKICTDFANKMEVKIDAKLDKFLSDVNMSLSSVVDTVKCNEKLIANLEKRCDSLDQHNKRKTLRILGIKEDSDEDTQGTAAGLRKSDTNTITNRMQTRCDSGLNREQNNEFITDTAVAIVGKMLPIIRIIRRNHRRRERNRPLIAARRNIRDENYPFSLPDIRFIELFRVDKELARHLIDLLRPHIAIPVSRRGIRVERKVFVALRFYATGSYQRCVGEEYNCSLSQSSVHICIHQVTKAIVTFLAPHHINFANTVAQRNEIKTEFMNKYGFPGALGAIDGWLIGDSGYPESSILMTPFRDPAEGILEARYNYAHIRARNAIEMCIGVLKSRFRCLLKERTARYAPEFVCDLIKCCAVLHNMCIERHILVDIENIENVDIPEPPLQEQQQGREGIIARQRLIERYFVR